MRFGLFARLFLVTTVVALLDFAFTPDAGLLYLAKSIALGAALSLVLVLVYPELRGIRPGDLVAVVANSNMPTFFGKSGVALTPAKVNHEITVRLDDGQQVKGILESYSGFFSLPKVRAFIDLKPPLNVRMEPRPQDEESAQRQLPPPPDKGMYR